MGVLPEKGINGMLWNVMGVVRSAIEVVNYYSVCL